MIYYRIGGVGNDMKPKMTIKLTEELSRKTSAFSCGGLRTWLGFSGIINADDYFEAH